MITVHCYTVYGKGKLEQASASRTDLRNRDTIGVEREGMSSGNTRNTEIYHKEYIP